MKKHYDIDEADVYPPLFLISFEIVSGFHRVDDVLSFLQPMKDHIKNVDGKENGKIDQEKIEIYRKMFLNDSVDKETYEQIFAMIPSEFIVEKERSMTTPEGLGFQRKTTKWKLSKERDKKIISDLKAFAQEKRLGMGNQLMFNDHFDDIYVRTIYFIME